MRIDGNTDTWKLRIASLLFAVFCVLSPAENAFAVPNLTLSTSFTPADGIRTYMDVGGVWDGLSIDLIGDTFTLTIENIGADPAYDIRDIPVNVPPGFVLDNSSVSVTDSGGGCPNMNASANQAGAGNPVTINIQSNNNTRINPGCTYNFAFELETNVSVTTGGNTLNYTVSYNTIDGDNGSQVTEPVEFQNIDVRAGALSVTKTGPAAPVADGATVSFTVAITNTGSGGLFDVLLTDVLGAHFDPTTIVIDPVGFPPAPVGDDQYTFDYLAAGDTLNVSVQVDVDVDPSVTTCPDLINTANITDRTGDFATDNAQVLIDLSAALSLTHSASSFCELCGDGTVRLLVQNSNSVTLTNVVVTEDISTPNLNYVTGTTYVSIDGGPLLARADPTGSLTNFTWSSAEIPELANIYGALTGSSPNTIEIYFDVRRPANTEEGLTLAVRDITASATYNDICLSGPHAANPPAFVLPLDEPIPAIVKEGRNVEAGQNSGNYQPIVYGHENDDIIWRVNIQNTGQADLQDLLIADTVGGNFVINYICFSEGSAETTAITNNGGSAGPGCIPFDPSYPPTTFIDVAGPGNTIYYYVGRILPGQCTDNEFNTADIEWGCEADSSTGDGGISVTSTGVDPLGSAEMSTDNGGGLTITRDIRGIDGGPEIGSNGEVTITITNDSGGTVSDLVLDNLLPAEYVRDTSFPLQPNFTVVPLYGTYDGMIDTITDSNEQALLTDNTNPVFTLTSSSPPRAGGEGHDANLMRAGDVITIVFRIVLVDQPHFDVVANLDVIEEDPTSIIPADPPNTDPDNAFTVTNTLSVSYLDTCDFAAVTLPDIVDTFQADIEDLDVTTSAPLYILTDDPAFPVPLIVEVTNNGGHDANNYYIYVSFGETMTVQSWSSTDGSTVCTSIGIPGPNPIDTPARAVWDDPAFIPASAEVYRCTGGTINPTQQVDLTFNVIKNTASTEDDLTFRADVVGVIEQDDGTEVVVTPLDNTIPNTTSNYTLDAIRSRVMGFNLTKTLPGACSEDASVPAADAGNLIIGEDCTYHIEAGGWFGFATPGFTLIEVNSVVVTDDLDDGQGYVQHNFTNDAAITNPIVINGGAGSTPVEETDITWAFNPVGDGITEKDQYFKVDITTRLLNDPVDSSAPPNLHAAGTFDIGKASFVAVFDTATYDVDETLGIPGYPDESVRRIDLTMAEPSLSVVKEVCNETLYDPNPPASRTGASCTNFTTLADDGDTQDSYVYRIIVSNQELSSGVRRAPAYNIISTDTLDASDLMLIVPFGSDGLDNDGDGATDEADEATILSTTNNIVGDATPAVITVSHTTSSALQRIDPNASVTFYYRVDPDDAIAPLQTLTNDVEMAYDSLWDVSGNQFAEQRLNSDPGGARVYGTTPVQASVRILPLAAQPKVITAVSSTGLTVPTQNVVIGEEILYELRTFIPVAQLRDFKIRDELPAGIRCIQAQDIDLNAAPYSAAGFRKNGLPNTVTFPGSCDPTGASNVVEWTFGDQELTTATDNNLFEFTAWFIARVDNSATNNDGDIITNGGVSTVVTTSYIDDLGALITLNHAAVDIQLREPEIVLTKRFTDALGNDISNADAGDIVTVTVTAENTGTATAYNLQILDDLTNTRMTYVGGFETGVIPDNSVIPDNIDTISYGANQPIFNWDNQLNPGYALDVDELISFTFQVRVDIGAQPLEILDNTLQGSWTSLPDINTTLNTTPGTIGTDGAIDGMRNGVLPNAGDTTNDYETTASDLVSVLPLTFSKTDLDPAITTLPVGDHKQFQIDINFQNSEGTTHAVLVRDNLAFSGLSYVLENEVGFDITYDFQGIDTINGQPPAEAVFNSFPADEANNIVTWDIGTVVTQSEDDQTVNAISPRIRITYYARVNNDANTNRDDTLQNFATLNYQNGETPATTEILTDDTTAPITVIEPLLTVSKTLTNETPGKLTTDLPDAGDLIQYVITVNNNAPGNSIAYDVNLVDTLPADLNWYSGFTPTAVINGSPVVDFGLTPPGGEPAGPLVWGRDNGDDRLDIPVNGTLVLTYQAQVLNTSEANRVLANSVVVDWTSLDGASGYERDGSTVPTYNDYVTAPAAVATTTVIDNNSITKARNDDSYLDTGNVRVGDTVDYTLTLTLQEGTTRAITLVDTLPNGMEFVGVLSVNGDTTAPYSSAGVFSHADISAPVATTGTGNNTVSWTLGNAVTGIVNAADNNAANDDFVIVYRAQVVNDELVIPQDASTNLTNTVVLDYRDGNNAAPAPAARLSDTETIVAQQPIIFTADLAKVRRSGLPSGNSVTSGETMDFRLSACNSGDAPAYDLILEDLLPAELNETTIVSPGDIPGSGTPPVVTLNGAAATAGVDYVYTPPAGAGGTMRFLFNNEANPVNPGQCAVIEFDISVRAPIGIDQTFTNNFQAFEYHSLDSDNLNQLERETYGLAGPVSFDMNTIIGIIAPDKSLLGPLSLEATIGEIITYQIKVPGDSGTMSVDLFDVLISDDMAPNLTFVDATLDASSGYTGAFDTSASVANQVRIAIDLLPVVAGTTQQAVFNIRARVNNDANTNALLPAPTPAFGNTVTYSFADSDGGVPINGGGAATPVADHISIVEPVVTLTSKTVANTTQAVALTDAGDILRYTLVIDTAAGATESDAFDISVIDNLGLGMTYIPGTRTVDGANTIVDPVITGDGITTAQTLTWDLANGTDIDIPEGGSVTIEYEVVVLDSVLASQDLSNSAVVQWTSLEGASIYERNGSNSPAYNDYFSGPLTATVTTPDNNSIAKTRLTDTYGAADADVRIGDIIDYELRLTLQEGTSPSFVLSDVLPQGLAYEETVSINGDTAAPYVAVAPLSHADFSAPTVSGDASTGPTTVSWNLGDVVNSGDNNLANNEFVIVYRARVLNDDVHPQINNIPLTNTVNFDYDTALGAAPTETSAVALNLLQPTLIVGKTAAPAGGDTVLDADELISYTVEIANTGTSPAYDTVLQDVIPFGLRNAGITVLSMGLAPGSILPNPNAVTTVLPNLAPVYDVSTGVAVWDFDSGIANQYNIPAGETLRIVYQVQADPTLSAGLIDITNAAQVQLYYSFDDDEIPTGSAIDFREIYGPSNIASVTLTTPLPNALDKQNQDPAQTTASIGEPFTYLITVPDAPIATALHDVRILDDLTASGLTFVSAAFVSGPVPFTPVNTGTPTNLVIEDTTTGIEIPAGTQVEIAVTVMLRNIPANADFGTFNNTASYEYNFVDGDNSNVGAGGADTSADMTIVEPTTLTLTKSGPANMEFGTPGTFSLDVQNIGTGPAWDLTLVDRIPNPTPGGMCDTAPANFTAGVYELDGTTLVNALVEGVDYVVNFVGDPTCELSIITQTANAVVGTTQRLIVTYELTLDPDNSNGSILTNHAGVTQWFSWDTAGAGATGEVREYTELLTDPVTAATVLDHEDAINVTINAPILSILKTVINTTTGQDPGSNASPGDTLQYTIVINNTGPVDANYFNLTDEPDRLSTGPALFEPGTLNIISIPVGSDASGSDAFGGTLGTGLLDVQNLSVPSGGSATIVFEMTLASVITNGAVVQNQAQVNGPDFTNLLSDDPNINGVEDPLVLGDEDPTETLIASAPAFQIYKTSQDLTGDPANLQPGDTLRYTITVRNIGDENAINSRLRDAIPVNTTYVANSTTLNGAAVSDPSAGMSALAAGMLINAPENTTPGAMQAVDIANMTNIATITFDVTVDATVINGTVISNQAFLDTEGVGSGPLLNLPSDDPGTPLLLNDPTQDIVGNAPALDAQKTVAIQVDNGVIGQVDPGDTLRYTITISNAGTQDTTGVFLVDAVPVNTTYVPDSVVVNGDPFADLVLNTSPLIAGIDVSSSDLTLPFPGPDAGTISAGQSAIITFDVTVDGATAPGTIISNQGTVNSNEIPDEPTDQDGIDANGDQATIVVVGNVQLLSITKQVTVVGGGAAEAGGQLDYLITVTNIGAIPATNVVITDNLDVPVAGQITYVSGSAQLNGSTAGISFVDPVLTADYASTYGDLPAGQTAVLVFRVDIAPTVAIGDTITNDAVVSWDSPVQTATGSVDILVGGAPGLAGLTGEVWHNVNFDAVVDAGEQRLQGWTVDVYRNNTLQGSVQTDANGVYQILVPPNNTSLEPYELRFRSPGSDDNTTASLGNTTAVTEPGFVTGPQVISNVIVDPDSVTTQLNLPIEPNGVVYESLQRTPVVGAVLRMYRHTGFDGDGNPILLELPDTCFDDGYQRQQGQVTLANGWYKFDINFTAGCPAGADYVIRVIQPNGFYGDPGDPSAIIPPTTSATTAVSYDVPACPGDAVIATSNHCEAQVSASAPPTSVAAVSAGTRYYLRLTLDNGQIPKESQLFNNHIPLDPELDTALMVTKTTPLVNVVRGQLVPYTITVRNTLPVELQLQNVSLIDRFPAGFKYVAGSARLNDTAIDPVIDYNNLTLTWTGLTLDNETTHTIKMLLVVGAGVSEGEYVNRAVATITVQSNGNTSEEATATVRVVPDPTFDCSDVIGKVFNDENLNGYQDQGEKGIAGARVMTARGLEATSDAHGRFHITCALVPNQDRGSNFILKLDDRSLPSGFRLTTENPRVQRATRGKMLKYNFGAAIHRVVRLDMADGVFEKDSTEMRPQWKPRLDLLLDALKDAPSVLRLSYMADIEDDDLVDDRLDAVKETIEDRWQDLNCCYKLMIETEIFWRRGGPRKQGGFD